MMEIHSISPKLYYGFNGNFAFKGNYHGNKKP